MKFATTVVSILIVIAVLIPGKDLPDVNIGGYDKLIHMLMFATWALAVRFDFRNRPWSNFAVFGAGVLFSLVTEVMQILVEGRSFDLFDAAADAAGLILGLALSRPFLSVVDKMPWFTGRREKDLKKKRR